jgi:hypothetical protein
LHCRLIGNPTLTQHVSTRLGRRCPPKNANARCVLLLLCTSSEAAADSASFDGVVLRRGDRSPLGDISVSLDEREPVRTDEYGRFQLDAVSAGAHVLRVRGAAIDPLDLPERTTAKPARAKIYVCASAVYSSRVRGASPTVEPIAHALQGEELRRIPGRKATCVDADRRPKTTLAEIAYVPSDQTRPATADRPKTSTGEARSLRASLISSSRSMSVR